MRRCWIFLVITFVSLGCKDNPPAAPRNPIFGTWQTVSGEALGKKMEGKDATGMRITFGEGTKATWDFDTGGGWQSFQGQCRIDPNGRAGWIDLGEPKSDDPSRIARGIYKIDGDSLHISMDKDRPADFEEASLSKLQFKRVR